ncbi:MAG TPA: enoyl-CoA hydratase/isomerase family protein [Bradyrhizobium sp.]|nr:enoyl-CoA hydratase/isomerase family protein [Bradyrhizobium sp.]
MIAVEEHTGVAVVSLARPPVNALDLPMIEELESTFARLASATPRIGVVLTGAGNTFSAGVDTKAFASYGREERHRMVLAITRMTGALLSLPCPLVAAVNGHALGGGFVLMLCCDYRLVADDHALRLGLTEARAGVPFPAGPKHEMPGGLLRQMTLSSRVVSPQDLVQHGLIDALASKEQILENAIAAVRDLASQPAFEVVKKQVRGGLAADVQGLAVAGADPFLRSFG